MPGEDRPQGLLGATFDPVGVKGSRTGRAPPPPDGCRHGVVCRVSCLSLARCPVTPFGGECLEMDYANMPYRVPRARLDVVSGFVSSLLRR